MSSEVMQFYPEESEMAVLGHLIQNNEAFHPLAIAEGWEPGWHHNEHAIQLAEAVWEMRRKGMIVNSSTLLSHISAAGIKINDTYLAECVQADADNDTFLTHLRLVKNFHERKIIHRAGMDTMRAAAGLGDIQEVRNIATRALHNARGLNLVVGRDPAIDLISPDDDLILRLPHKGAAKSKLFFRNQVHIIGARPKIGKSTIATMLHSWFHETERLGLVSLEMDRTQNMQRMLTSLSGIPKDEFLREKNATDGDKDLVEHYMGWYKYLLENQPEIYMGRNIHQDVFAWAMDLAQRGKISILILDYLQLLNYDPGKKSMNRNEEIGRILSDFVNMARTLGVTVFCLSQFKRPPTGRKPNERPQITDFRDSGNIEQDAFTATIVHHHEDINITTYMRQPIAKMIWHVDLVRNAPSCVLEWEINKPLSRIEPIE